MAEKFYAKYNFYHRLLLKRLNHRNNSDSAGGFTLIELMIVVAIIGILAAIAIPNFIEARDSAKLGSRIGEASGFAKACAVWQSSQIGTAPSVNSGTTNDGVSGTCGTGDTNFTASWGTSRAGGVSCLDKKSDTTHTSATFKVSPTSTNQISCSFG